MYRRMSTITMLLLLVGGIGFAGIMQKTYSQPNDGADWKQALTEETAAMKEQLKEGGQEAYINSLKESIAINEYRLEHNLEPISETSFWGFIDFTTNFVGIIGIFTIIVAGGILASEFSWGTIKLLLIRPVKRSTILLSKYVSTLLFAFLMLIILFVVSSFLGGILFGFEGASQPYLNVVDGNVVEQSMLTHILQTYGLNSISLVMMVTFAFMVSTIFRNSSLAIGIAVFLSLSGDMIVMMLRQYEWVKYVLFANLNLSQYFSGTPLIEGMTLSFSLTVLAVYYVAFLIISWTVFIKRDVAA